jgi:outer membrane protein
MTSGSPRFNSGMVSQTGAPYRRFGNNSMHAKSILFAIVASLSMVQTVIADDCKGPSDECVAVGGWNFSLAFGAGIRTNPLVNSNDIPLVVIPHISYYGKRLFIDDFDLGFAVAETDTNTVSLVASPGYDRVYFYRSDLQNIFVGGLTGNSPTDNEASSPGTVRFPPRSRRVTYLAGPEWTFKYLGITGQIDVLQEITGQSGQEVRAALGIPIITREGTLAANVGVTWKSAAIVNYYYGAANIYEGGPALNSFLKLGYTLPLAGRWRFNAFAEYERLGSAITDSPIVAEHHVATMFVGAIYKF